VKLVVSIVSSALVAGRAQDVTFALALTNDGPRPAVVCAKDAPVAPLYELPSWRAQLAPVGGGGADAGARAIIPVASLFNPSWGAPAPPWVPGYLKEHGAPLAPGATLTVRLRGCWLPRAALPESARQHAGDGPHGSLLVVGDDCAGVTKALARGGGDALYGRSIAAISRPGGYAITFWYEEKEAYGFVPVQPIHVVAPPVRLDVPGS
jgi:hypothetical protein